MNHYLRLIIIILLIAPNVVLGQENNIYIQDDKRYGDLTDGLPEKDSLVQIKHENGKIAATGKMAVDKDGFSNLRIGLWKEYNDSGILKSEGNYKIGSYIQCCFSGACMQFYFYRDGLWKFYNDKGILSYEMEFEPSELHIETSCQGGDVLIFGLVKNIPLKYSGIITPDLIYENQKVTIVEEYGNAVLVPINGRLYWE